MCVQNNYSNQYGQEKLRFLVIDDEPDIVAAVSDIIRFTGNDAQSFTNPKDAINDFTAHPKAYDAVITDLRMPFMSGKEVIKEIRQHSNLPVMVITASYIGLTESEMAKLGVEKLLRKPFDFADIEAVVTAVRRHGQKAS